MGYDNSLEVKFLHAVLILVAPQMGDHFSIFLYQTKIINPWRVRVGIFFTPKKRWRFRIPESPQNVLIIQVQEFFSKQFAQLGHDFLIIGPVGHDGDDSENGTLLPQKAE